MDSLSTTFLALGLSGDAFAVSLSSGMLIQRIKINKALKIALFFGGFQCLMSLIGWGVGINFNDLISGVERWIAFGLLSFIGGKMIHESLQTETEQKKFNPLDSYTLLVLAIATSIDALAAGLGLSVLKSSIILAATLIGIVTFCLSFAGVFIGHNIGNRLNDKIEICGGSLLILIGAKILLEHLMI
ncbi:manganese efflux pump MntP [Myxosarcina sp. GI1(2024)]